MFKKRIKYALAACFALFFLFGQTAKAGMLKIYAGADYLYSDIKYKDSDTNMPDSSFSAIAPVIGISAFGIGLEAFYLTSNDQEEDDIETKMKAYGLSIVGEAPLSDNFSFVASLGMAKYKFDVKNTRSSLKYSEECDGPRLGVGLQYQLFRNLAIRGMYHYTLFNSGKSDKYDAMSEFSAGLRLIF